MIKSAEADEYESNQIKRIVLSIIVRKKGKKDRTKIGTNLD